MTSKWKYRISVRAVILSLSYFVFPFVKSGDPRPLGGLLPGSDPNAAGNLLVEPMMALRVADN